MRAGATHPSEVRETSEPRPMIARIGNNSAGGRRTAVGARRRNFLRLQGYTCSRPRTASMPCRCRRSMTRTIHLLVHGCGDAEYERRAIGDGTGPTASGNEALVCFRLCRKDCARPQSNRPGNEFPAETLHVETAFTQDSSRPEPECSGHDPTIAPDSSQSRWRHLGIIAGLVLIGSNALRRSDARCSCSFFRRASRQDPGGHFASRPLRSPGLFRAADRSRIALPGGATCSRCRPEPISILKPLAGLDLDLESNLRTFFEQDYPAFEILFAVRSEDDPAAAVVARLQREYPKIPSRLVVTGEPPYPNAKVYSLDRMLAAATNDLVVMSDSDIRVTPDLLRTVAAEFQDAHLGVATCPYRAVPGASFWSRLEATGMNTDFWGSAWSRGCLKACTSPWARPSPPGARVLQSIGGFERLKDYLAEDFVMGKFAAEAGHGVILSSYVVEHHIGSATLRQNVAHRLRWARSTRRSRPAGYVGQLFTMPLPLALLVCAASPAWWPVLPLTLMVRAAAAYTVSARVLRARDQLAAVADRRRVGILLLDRGILWQYDFWRGRRYRLFPDGRFELIPSRKE